MARGGKREGAGRKLSYSSYEKQYNDMQNKLASKGISMFQRKLSKSEFEAQFTRLKNQREMEIKKGKRKTLGNITRDLVDKQAYELTQAQAKAMLKEKRKQMGLTLQEVRSGEWLHKELNIMEAQLDDIGVEDAEREAQKYISTEYFGSP